LSPRQCGVVIGVLAGGLFLTALAAGQIKAAVEAAGQREFAFACNEVRLNIADRLASSVQVLRSGVAFWESSATVSRENWRTFSQQLQLEQGLPGIQGLGFALVVPREQLARHVQTIRAEGFPDYAVRPGDERELYSAIIYIEPFSDRNLRAFGYDMLSEPVRRAAMERARDANTAALSGKVTLVQETDREVQAGTLMFVPVYRQGAPRETLAQRRAALQGWVYSPYRMTDLMRGTLRGWAQQEPCRRLRLQVYDGETLTADTLLYDSHGSGAGAPDATATLTRLIPLDFAGRRWNLHLTLPSGLASMIDYRSVWLVGGGGTIINLLVFGLMLALLRTRHQARSLQDSAETYRALFVDSPDACLLIEKDAIVDANRAAEHVLHGTRPQLIGQPLARFSPPCQPDGRTSATAASEILDVTLRAGHHTYEWAQRRLDGADFPAEVSLAALTLQGRPALFAVLRDSTERQQAAQALQASEARYALTLAAVNDGLWDWNTATGAAWFSPTYYALLGYADREFTANYATWRLLVHPDDLVRVETELQLSVVNRTGFAVDLRMKLKSGDWHWVSTRGKVVERDAEGKTLRMVGTLSDITARKQAEEALQRSEERHRVVTDTMLYGLVHQRGNGTIMAMNPAAERILGRTIAEFMGSSSVQEEHHTIHEDGSPFVGMEHPAMVALRTGQSICNVVMGVWNPQRKERRWIEIDAVPVFAPGQASPTEVYTVFADITARKQAEQALQLQGAALAAAANAIIITDSHGTIEWANPAFSVLTGYTLAEAYGKNPRDLVKSGQQTAAFYRELWYTIRAGQVWHGELVNRRKDGTLYTEDMTITPLRAVGNTITHFIAIKQNVTERKELEAQLLRSQRLESIGRLAGGIAHDLNNILAPVLLAPPMLRAAISDPDTHNLVDIIETATKRGAEIIKQLLAFSCGLKSERVPLQLSLLVREMRTLMRETFPKNITVRLQLPTEAPLVLGDTTQLHQVLMNLCVNARDALPDGGELTLSLEAVSLDAAAAAVIPGARAGSFVVLGVGDNGTGIAPEILDKIYDPFFTTKAVGKGSGLGLSTTLGIVRGHAGFIQVRSAPGQGTLFRVFLPVSIESLLVDSTAAAKELPAAPQGHGALVLVVDDEALLRLMARKILKGNGYRVLEAEDGAEALRLLESSNELPQAVLTDLLMPRMDGLTLIRALRQLPVPPKIVAMGGIPPVPATLQESGLSAATFIAKPFDAASLLNALHTVLA
jgi:PAS domain S-box-containing protein